MALTKKQVVTFLLLIGLVAGLVAGVILSQTPQEIRKKAAGTGDVALSLIPIPGTVLRNQTVTIEINIQNTSTTTKNINVVGIDLPFNPAVFTASANNLSCGDSFPSSAKQSIANNTIYLTCSVGGGTGAVEFLPTKQAIVGSIILTVNSTAPLGQQTMQLTRSVVADADTSVDISNALSGVTLNIVDNGPTATIPAISPTPTIPGGATFTPTPTSTQTQYTIDVGTKGELTINIGSGGGPTATPGGGGSGASPTPGGGGTSPTPTIPADATPTPTTTIVDPSTPHIKFRVKLFGVQNTPEIPIRLKVVDLVTQLTPSPTPADTCHTPGPGEVFFEDILLSSNTDGVYAPVPGSIFHVGSTVYAVTDDGWVPLAGTSQNGHSYSFFVKGPLHRDMRMSANVVLESGKAQPQDVDWTSLPLEPGDLLDPNNNYVQDCTVNSIDISLIESRLGATAPEDLAVGDVNFDGIINGNDISKVVNTLSTKPDDDR